MEDATGANPVGEDLALCLSALDSDDDGVADRDDDCPDTPICAAVGGSGCAEDSDGDGVVDGCDVCDGFDDNIDTDGDGIADGCDVHCCGAAGPVAPLAVVVGVLLSRFGECRNTRRRR